jgi:hypothetical protein
MLAKIKEKVQKQPSIRDSNKRETPVASWQSILYMWREDLP